MKTLPQGSRPRESGKTAAEPLAETCAKCRYFQPGGDSGFCYRYPPQAFMALGDFRSGRPPVKLDWWCGEFLPKR